MSQKNQLEDDVRDKIKELGQVFEREQHRISGRNLTIEISLYLKGVDAAFEAIRRDLDNAAVGLFRGAVPVLQRL